MDLFLVKTWLKARLNVDTERGATMVEYVLILGSHRDSRDRRRRRSRLAGEQQVQPGFQRYRLNG